MNETSRDTTELGQAFRQGRRAGLGIAALALGVVSFISLLGTEKALLAIALGVLAVRGAARGSASRRMGVAAIVLGAAFIVTVAVLLAVYHDKVASFVATLHQLS